MSGFMQPQAPYQHIEEVIEDRARWSIALLDGLMQRGRSQGWLDGDVTSNALDHREAARAIQDRCQRSPLDPTLQPMQWLAIRMQLDEAQCDALWLLAMIDLVPAVTRLAEVFGPVMSVQTSVS